MVGEREQRKMRGKERFGCGHFEVFEVVLGLLAVTGVIEIVFVTMSLTIKKPLFTHPLSLSNFTGCFGVFHIPSHPAHVFTKNIFEEIMAVSLFPPLYLLRAKNAQCSIPAVFKTLRSKE